MENAKDYYGLIYQATNMINGKIYIGVTTQSLNTRKLEHKSESRNRAKTPFHHAISKYGFDNFSWEVLDYAYNRHEIDILEIKWIEEMKSYIHDVDSNGYNCTLGGSSVGSGKNHPMFGKSVWNGRKHTEETKKKMSQNHANFKGMNHPNFGKSVMSEEKRKLMSKIKSIPIVQLDLNGNLIKHWDSAKQVNIELGYDTGHLAKCCKKKYGKNKNFFKGSMWMYKSEYLNNLQT